MQACLIISFLLNLAIAVFAVGILTAPENRLRLAAWLRATAREQAETRKARRRLWRERVEQQQQLSDNYLAEHARLEDAA